MIVAGRFVYVHTSRHGGTFLNRMMMRLVPGSRMIGYHFPLAKLPRCYRTLPVIGFVRNPWDWYVSMFVDYARKRQLVWVVLSHDGTLGFEETIANFLLLGAVTAEARRHREEIAVRCPRRIWRWPHSQLQGAAARPGLERRDLRTYPDEGYYSWLWRRMHTRDQRVVGEFGRFEELRTETLRLLACTGMPVSAEVERYVTRSPALNAVEHGDYRNYYGHELRTLVAAKDRFIIERFGYQF